MMVKHKLLLIFLLCSFFSFSQTKETVLRDAKAASKATLEGNYDVLLNYTYPPILELMGGREAALKTIEASIEQMKSQGFVFEKADVVAVSDIVKEENQYRCYVENKNQMKMGNQRIFSKSFLLGIYDEEKKSWYFLEAERLKNKALTDKILPNFKTSLKIPDDEMKTEIIE